MQTPDQQPGLPGARITKYEINNHSDLLEGCHIQQIERHTLDSILQNVTQLAHDGEDSCYCQ